MAIVSTVGLEMLRVSIPDEGIQQQNLVCIIVSSRTKCLFMHLSLLAIIALHY